MSIYATLFRFALRLFGDDPCTNVAVQAVPPHIDDTGPAWEFLLP
jgi:hypothetical protein